MPEHHLSNLSAMILLVFLSSSLFAQEVQAPKSSALKLSGRVQMQHLYNLDVESDDARTNNGFRMRRGRLQASAKVNDFVSAKIQVEVRDNSPRLKDAEAKINFFEKGYLRAGQFKIPVWREEFMRSSGSLLLVERSAVASFLDNAGISARHVGLEVGSKLSNVSFALNYSNGAGEGVREDNRRKETRDFVGENNGKMVVARLDYTGSRVFQVGISAALNSLGNEILTNIDTLDNTGSVSVIVPDFGVYLENGLDIEGGIALGTIDKNLIGSMNDVKFRLIDVTGRWMRKLTQANKDLGGMDAFGFAAGVSLIDPNTDFDNNESTIFRFGPEVYFSKSARLQINAEISSFSADGVDNETSIRSQLTVNL